MSNVTLIMVDGGKIKMVHAHWRTIKSLLEHRFAGESWHREQPCEEELDAGYVLVDLRRNLLVNGQDAFAIPKGWDVAEA